MRTNRINNFMPLLLQKPVYQPIHSTVLLPRWRQPLIGYPMSLLLISVCVVIELLRMHLSSTLPFPAVPFLFTVVVIAFFWGIGPSILAILLSLLSLNYLYDQISTVIDTGWEQVRLLQLLTFTAAGTIIVMLVNQRESAHLRAVIAERDAVLRACQLAATFDAANDCIVVYDQNGRVLQTNAATHLLLGSNAFPADEQAHLEQELLQAAMQRDEKGLPLVEKRQPLNRILRGEALTGEKATDALVRTVDGRELVLNLSGSPIRNEQGKIERAVLIYRDVTERRHLERRTAAALQALLATAQVLVQPPECQDRDSEPAFLTKRAAQVEQRLVELVASMVESMHVVLLSVEADEELLSPLASVGLTSAQKQQWQEQLLRFPALLDAIGDEELVSSLRKDEVLLLDGMALPLYTSVLPYAVQTVLIAPICVDGVLVGLLCVDDGSREHSYTRHEMTLVQTIARLTALMLDRVHLQQGQAEAQARVVALHRSHQHMEDFLGFVCHELKSPLTIIRGSLQLAERKVKRLVVTESVQPDALRLFAPVQVLLDRAQKQVTIQDRLVCDLLDLSRIQRQTFKLFETPCDLVSIVQEVVEEQRQLAEGRTIDWLCPTERIISVYGDHHRLTQVVTNLLTNALKYACPERPIMVRLQVQGQDACVSVQDEGPGLQPAEQERIWERFYRAPGIEAQQGSGAPHVGLGVGLYLCRAIIEQHGGQIGVHSVPGQGSTFWFTVPLLQPQRWDEEEYPRLQRGE